MIDESIRGCSSFMRSIAMFIAALAASCGGSQAGNADNPPPAPQEMVVREPQFEHSLLRNEIELSPTPPRDPSLQPPPDDDALTRPILPFGAGMDRPKQISGPTQPSYPQEARLKGIQGTLVARCTITKEGRVNRCRILQAVPYFTNVALDTLVERQYTPVLYKGTAVDVDYTFPFRFHSQDKPFTENATRTPAPTEVCAKGWVTVRCTVEDAGAVGNCQLLESSLDKTTDQEILDEISTHRFQPILPEGAAVGTEATLKIYYRRHCAPPSQPQP